MHILGKIKVSCNQTGRLLTLPLTKLSKETGESLTKNDLIEGSCVLFESSNGRTYDVTICGSGLKPLKGTYYVIHTK